jgi:hypothetical protein
MNDVTGEQVKAATLAAGIVQIDHHECFGCGFMVSYSVINEKLFFNPACYCNRYWSPPEPRSWDSAAEWINMQKIPAVKKRIAETFGIKETA